MWTNFYFFQNLTSTLQNDLNLKSYKQDQSNKQAFTKIP